MNRTWRQCVWIDVMMWTIVWSMWGNCRYPLSRITISRYSKNMKSVLLKWCVARYRKRRKACKNFINHRIYKSWEKVWDTHGNYSNWISNLVLLRRSKLHTRQFDMEMLSLIRPRSWYHVPLPAKAIVESLKTTAQSHLSPLKSRGKRVVSASSVTRRASKILVIINALGEDNPSTILECWLSHQPQLDRKLIQPHNPLICSHRKVGNNDSYKHTPRRIPSCAFPQHGFWLRLAGGDACSRDTSVLPLSVYMRSMSSPHIKFPNE